MNDHDKQVKNKSKKYNDFMNRGEAWLNKIYNPEKFPLNYDLYILYNNKNSPSQCDKTPRASYLYLDEKKQLCIFIFYHAHSYSNVQLFELANKLGFDEGKKNILNSVKNVIHTRKKNFDLLSEDLGSHDREITIKIDDIDDIENDIEVDKLKEIISTICYPKCNRSNSSSAASSSIERFYDIFDNLFENIFKSFIDEKEHKDNLLNDFTLEIDKRSKQFESFVETYFNNSSYSVPIYDVVYWLAFLKKGYIWALENAETNFFSNVLESGLKWSYISEENKEFIYEFVKEFNKKFEQKLKEEKEKINSIYKKKSSELTKYPSVIKTNAIQFEIKCKKQAKLVTINNSSYDTEKNFLKYKSTKKKKIIYI